MINSNTLIAAGVVGPGGAAVVDVVGYGAATSAFEAASTTPNLTASTAAMRKLGGCTDTDNNSVDFANALPMPRNINSPTNVCASTTPPTAALPIVLKTCPASLSIDAGTAGFASLAGSDPDSIVHLVSITGGARAGIALNAFVAATSIGGNASVNLSVDAGVPSGVYKVDTFIHDASQSATCPVSVLASGVHTIFKSRAPAPVRPTSARCKPVLA